MLSKDRLIFDPADLSESDKVGAYLIGAGGTVLTSTTVGGDEALDVNLVASTALTVSATDLDIRDLDAAQDNIAISDGTDTLAINADGSINVNADVSATDFDIRDLSHTQDSIKIGDGTDFLAIAADGSIGVSQVGTWNVNLTDDSVADDAADTGNPFKVGGVAYASALSAASAGDRVNLAMDLYRRVRTNEAAAIAVNNPAAVTVGTSAVALPSSPLAGRKKLLIQNTSSSDVYVGASDVTTTKGIRIAKGAFMELDIGDLALYAIAGSAGNDVRILEVA
jgi:hypothetical protein